MHRNNLASIKLILNAVEEFYDMAIGRRPIICIFQINDFDAIFFEYFLLVLKLV